MLGKSKIKTPFGHTVPVYDIERTLCDVLRSRNGVEIQVFQDALKSYAKQKDKNLRLSLIHIFKTDDFMVARPVEFPWSFLQYVTKRITTEVPHVSRVRCV